MKFLFFLTCTYTLIVNSCNVTDTAKNDKPGKPVAAQQEHQVAPLPDSTLFRNLQFQSKSYFIFQVNPHNYNIEIFNKLPNSTAVYNFEKLSALKKDKLLFAVNGGMFEQDLSALGLLISNGKKEKNINLKKSSYGNFYLLPNGVFLIDNNNDALVVTSENYSDKKYKPKFATQSGPMLVTNGKINSNFTQGSKNTVIRNGVGINQKGEVIFAISEEPVNFYEFAELFRDELKCKNALYLDGVVSQYFVPSIHQTPKPGLPLGVFITVSRK
jgi:uncharacterized protein YigE (DUF2233 family)